MNINTSRRAMAALGSWAVGLRLIAAASMDGAQLMNSGWLSAILSCLMTIPAMLIIAMITHADVHAKPIALLDRALCPLMRRAFCLVLCLGSLYELPITLRMLTFSAEYSALDHHPMMALMTTALLGCYAACARGGAGLCGSALTWRPLYYTITAIVAIVMLQSVNPLWLMPIFGPGLGQIMRSAIAFAGMQSALITGWLCFSAESGDSQTGGAGYPLTGPLLMLRTLGRSAAISTGMTLIICMLSPAMPGAPTERDFNLEHFLANGQHVNTLQFPMMFTWFLSLAIMMGFYMYSAAALLGSVLPGIAYRWRLIIVTVAGGIMSISHAASRIHIEDVNTIRFWAVSGFMLLFAVGFWVKRRVSYNA